MSKCPECGALYGVHRGGCTLGPQTGPHWVPCDCGRKVWLLPIRDYHVEYWQGCHTNNMCETCPLQDGRKLMAKVEEVFGK